jgi:hypothetical protein
MKFNIIILFLFFTILSCNKSNSLEKAFKCKSYTLSNTKGIDDFLHKFRLHIPKHWKKNLYYDNVQTQVFTADTTKQLSQTYILDVALNSGELKLNDDFKTKVIQNLQENEQLVNLNSKFDTFKDKPCLWLLSKGEKQKKIYHFFQLFVLNSATDYYEITTKIYGEDQFEDRLCESISIINSIEFLEK